MVAKPKNRLIYMVAHTTLSDVLARESHADPPINQGLTQRDAIKRPQIGQQTLTRSQTSKQKEHSRTEQRRSLTTGLILAHHMDPPINQELTQRDVIERPQIGRQTLTTSKSSKQKERARTEQRRSLTTGSQNSYDAQAHSLTTLLTIIAMPTASKEAPAKKADTVKAKMENLGKVTKDYLRKHDK